MKILIAIIAALAYVGCSHSWQTLPPSKSSQAKQMRPERRLHEVLDALNQKSAKAISDLIANSFTQEEGKKPGKDFEDSMLDIANKYAPFTLKDVMMIGGPNLIARISDSSGKDWDVKLTMAPVHGFAIENVLIAPPGAFMPKMPKFDNWASAQDLAQQIVKATGVPAMALAIVRDGKVVDKAVTGTRRFGKNEPVQLGDKWLVGSVGKGMTATMIACLIDKGKLKWDSTIGEVLKDIPMREDYKKVTLLQLLRHRGGIPQDQNYTAKDVVRAVGDGKTSTEIRRNYAKDILAREPIDRPDAGMHYSNAGYALASLMAETATGESFEQLMEDYLFRPLGMKSATYGDVGSAGMPGAPDQPSGHMQESPGKWRPVAVSRGALRAMTAGAGGGLAMSIEDFANYAAFHLNGLRGQISLISKDNFDKIHDPAPGKGEQYGCGWAIMPGMTEEPFHGHNGSDGTFFADIAVFPKSNLAVVGVSNAGEMEGFSPSFTAVVNVFDRFNK